MPSPCVNLANLDFTSSSICCKLLTSELLHATLANPACAHTGGYDHTVKLWDVRAKQACHTHGTAC